MGATEGMGEATVSLSLTLIKLLLKHSMQSFILFRGYFQCFVVKPTK